MKKHLAFIVPLLVLTLTNSLSQEKTEFLTLSGYISGMPSMAFETFKGPFTFDYLIHNRLNFNGYINKNITFAAEFRNRFFAGNIVRSGSFYQDLIDNDHGFTDLSWNLIDKPSYFFNTTIDRAWIDFNYGKFQGRIGRQRINWGQTLIWNPNDIFNAYSFFDIDYAERPGSDAVRLQYYPNSSSALEAAVKADSEKDITGAFLFRFNKWSYDIQFFAGYFKSEDIVAGAGWSGELGTLAFRGEATWFQSAKHFNDSIGTGIFTAGTDKTFSNGSSVQIQLMYCNKPVKLTSFNTLLLENMTTKSLAFSRFASFGQISYPVTPLFTLAISAIWFPDLKGYFTGPSVDYSLSENLDCSLLIQHFYSGIAYNKIRVNIAFLKIRFNF